MPELRYHHIGIPTDKPLPEEDYSPTYKLYASGYFQSPYGVEWMKFDSDCPLPELVKTVTHAAFVVEDLEATIAGKQILLLGLRSTWLSVAERGSNVGGQQQSR